ncbi:hypothetical protein K1T71_006440 [Dendrolimus kikuchii]|uniref:Uncharacterized protein n=1 Tax=Dendrolimus kikuchii TaxID=765133 RepID=A0ACC1D1Z3_9NEOP|nr:hypothetical protein K1T71_006440 [Dendrolimus kikuchii]
MACGKYFINFYTVFTLFSGMVSMEIAKEQVDKVIEDEITEKLSVDLLQSIERKFQVDLQKSVDMVLAKIKILLQNGTSQIQDKVTDLEEMLDKIKAYGEKEMDQCMTEQQNATAALAEKALHQMVVCGYALIGHDPTQAVRSVMALKSMIKNSLAPINERKTEVYDLLKVCGHDHDTLKKVVKCVISKSPLIKSAMMEVTNKLLEGTVDLTKQMAHGAMHEACLIEVIKNIEDEAVQLVNEIRNCVYKNVTVIEDTEKFIEENNATVIDVGNKIDATESIEVKNSESDKDVKEMKDILRRMLSENKGKELDKKFKKKLKKLQKELGSVGGNKIED